MGGKFARKNIWTYDADVINELIKDIREKIQFLVMAEILCSTTIFGVFKAIGFEDGKSYQNASVWLLGAAFVIVNYILIGFISTQKSLRWIKALVYVNLITIAFLIVCAVLVLYKPLPGYYIVPFQASVTGTIILPIITMIAIFIMLAFQLIRDMKTTKIK